MRSRGNQQSQGWFFEKINKIDKILARLIKDKKKRNYQFHKMKGVIVTDPTDINIIIKEYYK